MTQTRPAPTLGPTTLHRSRRRRRGMLLLTACVAVAVLAGVTGVVLLRNAFDDSARHYLSTSGWPSTGEGAYEIGDQTPRAGANQQPVPIASVAKVMTALVVLADHPLHGADAGPAFVVTQRDVTETAARRARDESVVPVQVGERLTERQALMALLLPSANNVATLLARAVSGSVAAFVAEMNRSAHGLGMQHTTYTDPSGFDKRTVSTATDQLLLAEAAAKDPTLTALVATRTFRLPVAGLIRNTDTLLGTGGFVGTKTGSDDAAGGCFMFRAYRSVRGFNVQVIGVVLGQRGHRLIDAALYAAKQLVDRVAPTPAHA